MVDWTQSYTPGVPGTISFADTDTFSSIIQSSLQANRPKVAATCMGASWTYGKIDDDSRGLAGGLQSLGLEPGARVAIMMPSLPQYFVAILGILRAGYVVVNVNPLYTAREVGAQLNDSGAEAIIVLEQFAAAVQEVEHSTNLKHVIVTSIGDLYGPVRKAVTNVVLRKVKKMVPAWSPARAHGFTDFIAKGHRAGVNEVTPGAQDTAVLQYTGGTTGVPKGAVLTQRNLLAAATASGEWLQPALNEEPRIDQPVFLIPLPLYHVFTLYVCSMGLTRGARMELVPNPRDLDSLIKAMKATQFHLMIGLNTLYSGVMGHPKVGEIDFSTSRAFVAGGAATTQGVADKWQALTNRHILEGWGMTESSGAGTCNPFPSKGFNGTIGLPMPGVTIEIRDEDGKTLPQGEDGEIWMSGENIMQGYWNKPEETAKVMDERGFLATGDIGTMDERGFVRLVDRKKDMVLVSGFNVYPNEIENVMSAMDGVAETAAIGIPDEKSGEAVKLFVVKGDADISIEDVKAYCAQNLTGYKRPKQIVFLDELPKSAVGKVLRKDLREL